jgi:hypothetical protein
MNRPIKLALALSAACLLSLAIVGTTTAQGGNRVTLSVLAGRVPSNVGDLRALKRYARGHRATRFNELFTDRPPSERRWELTMVLEFARPLTGLEYQVAYYDVTNPADRRLVTTSDIRVQSRSETVFVNDVRLPRSEFRPNRDIDIVIRVDRRDAGHVQVHLVGEELQRSNEIDFTRPNP